MFFFAITTIFHHVIHYAANNLLAQLGDHLLLSPDVNHVTQQCTNHKRTCQQSTQAVFYSKKEKKYLQLLKKNNAYVVPYNMTERILIIQFT